MGLLDSLFGEKEKASYSFISPETLSGYYRTGLGTVGGYPKPEDIYKRYIQPYFRFGAERLGEERETALKRFRGEEARRGLSVSPMGMKLQSELIEEPYMKRLADLYRGITAGAAMSPEESWLRRMALFYGGLHPATAGATGQATPGALPSLIDAATGIVGLFPG